jgi:hypothetical protein
VDTGRARKIKIALAALAVLGLGAALTSAQWTDQVFFRSTVSSGTFNIQGAVSSAPTTWLESTSGTPVSSIELDLGTVAITPSESVVLTGFIRNDPASTWTGDVSAITVDQTGLPAGVTATVAYTTTTPSPTNLAPGEVVSFTVTVTSDATLVQGATGALVVQVNGTSVAPV